ncbi:TPA: PTS system mannose/fructose/sorbose family transporter subunit IID [Streptococcus suis]|nr:PTS system mannose/fructose/sorbose family transporter subunit IID [Streptococcus suis]
MTISWLQAALLGLFACLASMPGMGGSSVGNYTLGRPLVGGLVCGLILGDVATGVMCGVAMQLVYIALVTPGGTVSYELGDKAVEFLVGPQGQAIRKSVSIVGGMVIGAVAATWVSVKTSFQLGEKDAPYLVLQEKLDSVYPGLLTAGIIVFCWWLMAKKNLSPIKTMLLLVVIAFIGVVLGFFDPGLSY